MADPRLTLDYTGQNAEYLTVKIDDSTITYSQTANHGSSQVGLAVTWTAAGDGTIELVGDGEFVLGKLIQVQSDNYATVQVSGAMKLPAGTAASMTEGKSIVGDLLVAAEGYVREVATGTAAELGVARGFIITDGADSDGYHQVYL